MSTGKKLDDLILIFQKLRRLVRAVLISLVLVCGFSPALLANNPGERSSLVLIVNEQNNLQDITVRELSDVFLKQRSSVRGQPLKPLNLTPERTARKLFDRSVHNQSTDKIQEYWLKQKVKGEQTEPRVVPTSIALAYYIRQFEEGIGYVPDEFWINLSNEDRTGLKPLPIRVQNPQMKDIEVINWKSGDYPLRGIIRTQP